MNLRDRTKQLANTLPLMENREKGDLLSIVGSEVTINDFGYLKDELNKEYVVFTVKEDEQNFYFGGQVLTEDLQELENDGYGEEIRTSGLPILLERVMSKNKREYTKVTYFPEA